MKYAINNFAKSAPDSHRESGQWGQGLHCAAAGRAHVDKIIDRV
ncbi:hypothetical protein [Acidovorax sp. Leaf160]|nr:hypothetical protein [Acidovorax sp. Leaf160]